MVMRQQLELNYDPTIAAMVEIQENIQQNL